MKGQMSKCLGNIFIHNFPFLVINLVIKLREKLNTLLIWIATVFQDRMNNDGGFADESVLIQFVENCFASYILIVIQKNCDLFKQQEIVPCSEDFYETIHSEGLERSYE